MHRNDVAADRTDLGKPVRDVVEADGGLTLSSGRQYLIHENGSCDRYWIERLLPREGSRPIGEEGPYTNPVDLERNLGIGSSGGGSAGTGGEVGTAGSSSNLAPGDKKAVDDAWGDLNR